MTKTYLYSIALLWSFVSWAQSETEVYVARLNFDDEHFKIASFRNVSNNPGYDNQPSFSQPDVLVYAKTNTNGLTDISTIDLKNNQEQWPFKPTPGGEYSPVLIPGSNNISAVRLDPDGKQRLYSYHLNTPSKLLFNELQVAYYAWHDDTNLLGSVLAGNQLDLVIANVHTQKADTILEGVGRSIHKVPSTETMSYTALNEEGNLDIYQLDMASRESFFVTQLPIGIQDHIWLDDSKILIGSGHFLFLYDLFGDGDWKKVADLSQHKLTNITRLALSPDSKTLALVAEPILNDPGTIVDAHIAPYNQGDVETFAKAFAEDILVRRFSKDTMYIGRDALFSNYKRFMKDNDNLKVEVVNRIVLKNIVIDEEKGTVNDQTIHKVTIYETDELINSMTFIKKNKELDDPTTIVNKQLEAYNARDIDAFMKTYSQDVLLEGFPNRPFSTGQGPMKSNYEGYFSATPDLHCEIKNRIVLGNKVIDEELVTANGKQFSAIAIYEVHNGLISKVTFIQ